MLLPLALLFLRGAAPTWQNGLARTPAMGFSTWNWKQTCTTSAMVRPLVESLASRGLVKAGYSMFMADCAGPSRLANGTVALPEAQWPGGIAAWNELLHSRNMSAGFYTDYGIHGCCQCPWQTNPGSTHSFGDAGHIKADMLQLAQQGVDYVKVDSCQPVLWRNGKPDDPSQYARFRDGIAAAASVRRMTYSIIGFKGNPQAMAAPADGGGPYSWLNKTGNSWRTSNDISYSFAAVLGNVDSQENIPGVEALAGPGGFSDLDMLMFGNAKARLTAAEAASHLALWAILKAPLLLSTDIDALTEAELAMLTNPRMIAISQDRLGRQAKRVLPEAVFQVGGAVVGARSVPSYSLPLNQNWVQAAVAGQPDGVFQLRNLGAGLCLGRREGEGSSADGDNAGTVVMLTCDANSGSTSTHWRAIAVPPTPTPHPHTPPGNIGVAACATATEWVYIPSGDTTTGGGSLSVAASSASVANIGAIQHGAGLMLTDQHCGNYDAKPGDAIIAYKPTPGSCNGQRPYSNQAFTLRQQGQSNESSGLQLLVQQNGQCVSVAPCLGVGPSAGSSTPATCVTAELCGGGAAAAHEQQRWGWWNNSRRLQLLGDGDSEPPLCLNHRAAAAADQHAPFEEMQQGSVDTDLPFGKARFQLSSASDPQTCLGLAPVPGTSEFMQSGLVNCSDASATHWRYGSSYLNMTFGSLSNGAGLSLDAAPRHPQNTFAGPLADGGWAVLLLNRADVPANISMDLTSALGVPRGTKLDVTEVWSGQSGGTVTDTLSTGVALAKHESVFATLAIAE